MLILGIVNTILRYVSLYFLYSKDFVIFTLLLLSFCMVKRRNLCRGWAEVELVCLVVNASMPVRHDDVILCNVYYRNLGKISLCTLSFIFTDTIPSQKLTSNDSHLYTIYKQSIQIYNHPNCLYTLTAGKLHLPYFSIIPFKTWKYNLIAQDYILLISLVLTVYVT